MRDQIKQLIDLVESEGWPATEGVLHENGVNLYHFHPHAEGFPRIAFCGVQLDKDTYESFAADERAYVESVFQRRRDDYDLRHRTTVAYKLTQFLATRSH